MGAQALAGRVGTASVHLRRSRGASIGTRAAAALGIAVLLLLPRGAQVGGNPGMGSPTQDVAVLAPTSSPAALSGAKVRAIYEAEAAKPRYEGVLLDWRIASYTVLEREQLLGQNIARSCDSKEAGPETKTQLDFEITYLPAAIEVRRTYGPVKWVCDGEGLSVLVQLTIRTPMGPGEIWVERAIRGNRVIEMDVPIDSVETGEINGRSAILVHPADDDSGLGLGRIVVIEDDTDPEYVVLSVTADEGVPFDELIRIAEGIR